MHLLSEDDRNLRTMTPEALASAWDLWFDLAQASSAADPPYTHRVFVSAAPLAAKHDQPPEAEVRLGRAENRGGSD